MGSGRGVRQQAVVVGGVVALAAVAQAGTYHEVGDAGQLPGTAQVVGGTGALDSIVGSILNRSDADVFRIYIADAAAFSATVSAGTNFDSQLFLFDSAGRGLFYNDQSAGGNQWAGLTGFAASDFSAGNYLLGISRWSLVPMSGSTVTFQSAVTGVHVPAATTSPMTSWDFLPPVPGEISSRGYTINLTGASFILVRCRRLHPRALAVSLRSSVSRSPADSGCKDARDPTSRVFYAPDGPVHPGLSVQCLGLSTPFALQDPVTGGAPDRGILRQSFAEGDCSSAMCESPPRELWIPHPSCGMTGERGYPDLSHHGARVSSHAGHSRHRGIH